MINYDPLWNLACFKDQVLCIKTGMTLSFDECYSKGWLCSYFFLDTPMPEAPYHVPTFLKILCDQGYEEDSIHYFNAFVGRIFRPLRLQDEWQSFPYLIGIGATGKTTLLRAIRDHIFKDPTAVASLPGGSKQFALSTLDESRVWMNTDLQVGTFCEAIDAALFNKLVDGETVTINIKNVKVSKHS